MQSESEDIYGFTFQTDDPFEINPLLSITTVMILETCRDEIDVVSSYFRKNLQEKQYLGYIPIEKR